MVQIVIRIILLMIILIIVAIALIMAIPRFHRDYPALNDPYAQKAKAKKIRHVNGYLRRKYYDVPIELIISAILYLPTLHISKHNLSLNEGDAHFVFFAEISIVIIIGLLIRRSIKNRKKR